MVDRSVFGRVGAGALALLGLGMAPDAVVGRWRTESDHALVEIARCGGSICGRLVGSDILTAHPDDLDRRNADAALRGRRLMGLVMLRGFTAAPEAWIGGTIYDADDGRTYHARVTPIDADHLRVRGCVFVPLCRSQVWVRVGAVAGAP